MASPIETTNDTAAGNIAVSRTALRPHVLHEVSARIKAQRPRNRVKTRELIGFLLGHGARAWRSSLPEVSSHVRAYTPGGHLAVRIRFCARQTT